MKNRSEDHEFECGCLGERNQRDLPAGAALAPRAVAAMHMLCLLLFLTGFLHARSGFAAEGWYPLEAADTSSPRATLRSFREACDEIYNLIKQGGTKYRTQQEGRLMVYRLFQTLNLSEVSPTLKDDVAGEAAVCLKEVFDRIEMPPEGDIPGVEEMQALPEGAPRRWIIPHTEITIAKVTEGPRQGAYLFTPATVERAAEFYHRTEHLTYKPGASEGFYDWYLSEPGWMIPTTWIHALPKSTRRIVHGVTIWQWIGLILTFAVGLLAMVLSYRAGTRLARVGRESSILRYSVSLLFPIAAMLVPLAMKYFIADQLTIRGSVLAVVKITLDVAFLVAVVVVLVGAANRLAEIVIASPRIQPKGIDAQLIRLSLRVASLGAAAFVLLEGGRQIGIPLTTLLAGAGVGGLTVALAAQDTLRNFFGSMMIILDRPYRVGERIVVKDYDGVVEEIGLRSTKIRLLTGHLATIPNEEMAKTDIENIGRRLHIRRIQDLAIPYETSIEKVEKALEIVRTALTDHEGMDPDFPPRTYFTEFHRDCLNLRMIYWYQPPNYWDFLAFSEKLNVGIMREFEAAAIEFALPTTTTYMTQVPPEQEHDSQPLD